MFRIPARGPLMYLGWALLFIAIGLYATALLVGELAALAGTSALATVVALWQGKAPGPRGPGGVVPSTR